MLVTKKWPAELVVVVTAGILVRGVQRTGVAIVVQAVGAGLELARANTRAGGDGTVNFVVTPVSYSPDLLDELTDK